MCRVYGQSRWRPWCTSSIGATRIRKVILAIRSSDGDSEAAIDANNSAHNEGNSPGWDGARFPLITASSLLVLTTRRSDDWAQPRPESHEIETLRAGQVIAKPRRHGAKSQGGLAVLQRGPLLVLRTSAYQFDMIDASINSADTLCDPAPRARPPHGTDRSRSARSRSSSWPSQPSGKPLALTIAPSRVSRDDER